MPLQYCNKKTYSEIGVERAIVHKLHDNHGRVYSGHHPIEFNHMVMVELAHDGRFIEKVRSHLTRRARLKVGKGYHI